MKKIFCLLVPALFVLIFVDVASAQQWWRNGAYYRFAGQGNATLCLYPLPNSWGNFPCPPAPVFAGPYWYVNEPDGSVTAGRIGHVGVRQSVFLPMPVTATAVSAPRSVCSSPPVQAAMPIPVPPQPVETVRPTPPPAPKPQAAPVTATPAMKPAPPPMAKPAVPAPVEKSPAQLAKVPPGTEVSCMVMPPLQEDRTINGVLYKKGQMLYLVGRKTPNGGYINKFGEPTTMPDIETSPPPGVKTFPYEPPNI